MTGIAPVASTPCDGAARPRRSWTRTANTGPLEETVPAAGLVEPDLPGRGDSLAVETGIPMAIDYRHLPRAATPCRPTAPSWMEGTDQLSAISEKS